MKHSILWSGIAVMLLSGCQTLMISGAQETAMAAAENQRTLGEAVDDTGIYAEINHYFLQTDVNDLLPNVNVMVRQGRVLLTGKVDKRDTVIAAVRSAWKADGVKEVINEIEVNPSGSILSRANDEIIEKQVEARLTLEKGVNILNFSVEVVNGKVYLLGNVENDAELQKVFLVSRTTQGVQQVVSHLRLPQQKPRDGVNAPPPVPAEGDDVMADQDRTYY